MRSVVPMRIAKIGYLVLSILMCVFGILLIIFAKESVPIIGIIIGVLMILFGVVKVIGYFSKDLYRLAFQNDFTSGVVMITLGVLFLINTERMLSSFCILLGILVFMDCLLKIRVSIDAKRFGISSWPSILISAVLAGLFGLLLLFNTNDSLQIINIMMGISILLEGIMNFITILIGVKIIQNQKPEIIEYDSYDK